MCGRVRGAPPPAPREALGARSSLMHTRCNLLAVLLPLAVALGSLDYGGGRVRELSLDGNWSIDCGQVVSPCPCAHIPGCSCVQATNATWIHG
eukprot:COSAG06_NODE_40173_length_404_cov_1.396721_2_plen_92_part_01